MSHVFPKPWVRARCANCHRLESPPGDDDQPMIRLGPVRIDGEVRRICVACRGRVLRADGRPADPAETVREAGPEATMRLPPSGIPITGVIRRDKPIEIARPVNWRRS